MKSVMQHNFSRVPKAEIPRSSFNRSHGVKTTFDAGYLIPFFVDEALPGDTFNLRTAGFTRMATPIFPVMDNMFLETFYFAVPFRLVWANFKRAMGEQTSPGASTDFTTPQLVSPAVTGYAEASLFDYLGLPTKVPDLSHSALYTRAYNLIWNEWFRDQNLQNPVVVDTDDGPDAVADYTLLRRGKRHDYFTSSLPWPQKGVAVDIPLGTSAPVIGMGKLNQVYGGAQNVYETDGTGTTAYAAAARMDASSVNEQFYVEDDPNNAGFPNIRADLQNASGATINALRQAFQVQKMYERDARSGSRYTELVLSHFGVSSPDARLQRPEFLGGGQTTINFHPVAATATTSTDLGELAAFATGAFQGHGFSKSFTEHTIVMGFLNVRADLNYQQGLNRMWSRSDRLDYYWPALSQIGEQAVLNKEIYAVGSATPGQDDAVFGYQERFAEYRYKPSIVTGLFRSNCTASLDAWHLSQDFASLPVLNASFIVDNPPVDRVIAVSGEVAFIGDFYHQLTCARPMPLYGVPGSIDRF